MILIVAFAGPTAGVMEVTHDSAAASVPKKGGNVQFAAAAPANPVSTHAATSAVRTNATHLATTPRTCNSATLRMGNCGPLNAWQHQRRPINCSEPCLNFSKCDIPAPARVLLASTRTHQRQGRIGVKRRRTNAATASCARIDARSDKGIETSDNQLPTPLILGRLFLQKYQYLGPRKLMC
jgi:hypothetical protein